MASAASAGRAESPGSPWALEVCRSGSLCCPHVSRARGKLMGRPVLVPPCGWFARRELRANSDEYWLNICRISPWNHLLVPCFSSLNCLLFLKLSQRGWNLACKRVEGTSEKPDWEWCVAFRYFPVKERQIHSVDSCCHRHTESVDGPQIYYIDV